MSTHIYQWDGCWWVSRNGRGQWRRGVTLNDVWWPTFEQAAESARSWWLTEGHVGRAAR